jgi:hypothetical protein
MILIRTSSGTSCPSYKKASATTRGRVEMERTSLQLIDTFSLKASYWEHRTLSDEGWGDGTTMTSALPSPKIASGHTNENKV